MKRNLIIALTLIFLGVFISTCSAAKITVLDVGQGDSILVECDETILIDTGPPEERDKLAAALLSVGQIDKLILTHPHADHIGNAFWLIENKPVVTAYDNGEISASSHYLNYLAGLSMEGVGHVSLKAGDNLTIGDVTLQILNPAATYDVNNNSLVIKLTQGNFSMLMTGDIGFMAEADILSRNVNLNSTVLKAAHHGSKTSSSFNFIQAVNPKAVVISAGLNNKFGHPSPESLTAYLQFTKKIYCTAFNGDIIINTDGQTWSITPTFSSNWLSTAEKSDTITRVTKL